MYTAYKINLGFQSGIVYLKTHREVFNTVSTESELGSRKILSLAPPWIASKHKTTWIPSTLREPVAAMAWFWALLPSEETAKSDTMASRSSNDRSLEGLCAILAESPARNVLKIRVSWWTVSPAIVKQGGGRGQIIAVPGNVRQDDCKSLRTKQPHRVIWPACADAKRSLSGHQRTHQFQARARTRR